MLTMVFCFFFDCCKIVAPRVLCKDTTQVDLFIQHIIDDGGEGVILRKLRSKYEYGRTSTLFKLKV